MQKFKTMFIMATLFLTAAILVVGCDDPRLNIECVGGEVTKGPLGNVCTTRNGSIETWDNGKSVCTEEKTLKRQTVRRSCISKKTGIATESFSASKWEGLSELTYYSSYLDEESGYRHSREVEDGVTTFETIDVGGVRRMTTKALYHVVRQSKLSAVIQTTYADASGKAFAPCVVGSGIETRCEYITPDDEKHVSLTIRTTDLGYIFQEVTQNLNRHTTDTIQVLRLGPIQVTDYQWDEDVFFAMEIQDEDRHVTEVF